MDRVGHGFCRPKNLGTCRGGPPQVMHFNRVWNHYKPSILVIPLFFHDMIFIVISPFSDLNIRKCLAFNLNVCCSE